MGNVKRHGDYEAFLERHAKETKGKNTDELFTPPTVYEVVLKWVQDNCPSIQGKRIMRPFRPGGDYKSEDYEGAVVIDNPPFFCENLITRWYVEHGVPFFLFAPGLSLFNGVAIRDKLTYVATKVNVEYTHNEEVHAVVPTSFITNLPEFAAYQLVAAPELREAILKVQGAPEPKLTKIEYHPNLVTPSRISTLSEAGIPMRVRREETLWYRNNLENSGTTKFFGGAFIVSDRVAAAVEEAIARKERAAIARKEQEYISKKERAQKYYEPTPEALYKVNHGEGGTL